MTMKRKIKILDIVILAVVLLLGAIILTACATPVTLTTKVEKVEVPVPFVDKCISAADVPAIPPSRMPKSGTVDQLAAGASLDVRALSAYAATADALLRMCSQP